MLCCWCFNNNLISLMNQLLPALLGLVGVLLFGTPLSAQIAVSVNANNVRNDVSEKPFGLNTNTWVDGDGNRPPGARPLRSALSETPLKNFLRFPGGEKSDGYEWAAPPYNDPTTSGLARTDPENDYPAGDPAIWDTLAGTWANDDYNFFEFMEDCTVLGSEPVIAVAMDGIYKPATRGYESLTKQEAIDMAVGWVRYANVTNNYGVKYWLIGNETWSEAYNGGNLDAGEYGRDVAEFARAMKAVDPTILIGINGNSQTYFENALAECAADVDFLDVHSYPCFGFDEYDDYRNRNTINPRGIVGQAQRAINSQSATDRSRLFITLTETSAYGYTNGEWNQGNNIGQALANVDIFGQLAGDSRVAITQFWNTRWVKEDLGISHGEDFFFGDNTLNASGRLLTHFAQQLRDNMLATTSSNPIRVFASSSADGNEMTVFIINKSRTAESVELTLNGFAPAGPITRSEFRGSSVTDANPTYAELNNLSATGNTVTFTASELSLTTLRFTGSEFTENCTANQLNNPSFETGDFTGWQTSANGINSFVGTEDRSSDGFVVDGDFIAFAGGDAEAEISQLITGLQPNTDYEFTAWVNYYTEEATPTPALVGVRDYGGTTLTESYAQQDFEWRQIAIPFTTGASSSQAEIFLNVNGTNVTYAWMDATSVNCIAGSPALPMKLLDFSGRSTNGAKELSWTVEDEYDLDHYSLRGSTDGTEWVEIARLPPHNRRHEQLTYAHTDRDSPYTLYRLHSIDLDGSESVSPVVSLHAPGTTEHARPYPNPTTGPVQLPRDWHGEPYTVTSALGQRVADGTIPTGGQLRLDALLPGVYTLTVGDRSTYRIVKR